ncbi:MAG: nucleotide exchange factor GrpE [Halioglobus sp.]
MRWSRKVADKENEQSEQHAGEEAAHSPENAAAQEEPNSDDDAGDAAGEPTLEDMVTQLQDDVAAAKDAALRAQADAQNVKRRAEQDVEKARKFALESFSKELLPVVDNLERALESASGDEEVVKPIAEGVELTLKSFLDALTKFNVAVVDPVGEPFDPNLHQAMSMVENPDVEPNTVLTVLQKGYTLNGRLVRPAMVMVSKSPA